jgi:hypothetical protein
MADVIADASAENITVTLSVAPYQPRFSQALW